MAVRAKIGDNQRSTYQSIPMEQTAKWHSKHNPKFLDMCKNMGIEPTVRQARAFLAKRGRWAS